MVKFLVIMVTLVAAAVAYPGSPGGHKSSGLDSITEVPVFKKGVNEGRFISFEGGTNYGGSSPSQGHLSKLDGGYGHESHGFDGHGRHGGFGGGSHGGHGGFGGGSHGSHGGSESHRSQSSFQSHGSNGGFERHGSHGSFESSHGNGYGHHH